jgi:hypothetical protein
MVKSLKKILVKLAKGVIKKPGSKKKKVVKKGEEKKKVIG